MGDLASKAPPRSLARILLASALFFLATFDASGGVVEIIDEQIDASLTASVRTSSDTSTDTHDFGPQIRSDPAVTDEILVGSFDSGYAYGSTEINLQTNSGSLLH